MNPSPIHYFVADHARRYGLVEAVLITNFQHWISRNKANGDHLRDGRTWTYNSVSAFAQQFPYLSADQVRRALDRLIALGVLVTGNYNARGRDRTRWFAFADEKAFIHSADPEPDSDGSHLANLPNGKGAQKSPGAPPGVARSHLAKMPDGAGSHLANLPNPSGKFAKCLIRTDVNTYKSKPAARALPWWSSEATVLAEAERLGIAPLAGESLESLSNRVHQAHLALLGEHTELSTASGSADAVATRRAALAQALAKAPGRKT